MNRFVERGGDPCQKHPCSAEEVTAHGFAIPAQRAALDRLVDRFLNEPVGKEAFRAAADWVVLLAAHIGRARNASSRAFIPDVDVSFWVPLRSTGELPRAAAFSFLIPYTFVSTGHGIAIGREGYGFNKALSLLDVPQPLPTSGAMAPLVVRTVAVQNLQADELAGFQPVITVTPLAAPDAAGAAPADDDDVWTELRGMLEKVEVAADPPPEPAPDGNGRILAMLGGLQAVFLRQLRDVEDPRRAAFQSVIQAPVRVTHPLALRVGRLEGRARLTLPRFESHPIATDLGLELDGASSTESKFAFWMKFAFELGFGTTLWASS